MKKIVLFMVLAGALLSCKKSNSGSGYHVTASVDGTGKAFNTAPIASKLSTTNVTQITVNGFAGAGGETVSLIIDNIPSGKPIVPGTYTDTTSDFDVALFYTQNLSAEYVGGTDETAGSNITIQNHVKIVITSIDATSIKGTFSGDAFLNADVTAAKKTITNGDFYVRFQ